MDDLLAGRGTRRDDLVHAGERRQHRPVSPKDGSFTYYTEGLREGDWRLYGLVAGKDGNMYVAHTTSGDIYRITPKGKISIIENPVKDPGEPVYLVRMPDGNIWTAGHRRPGIQILDFSRKNEGAGSTGAANSRAARLDMLERMLKVGDAWLGGLGGDEEGNGGECRRSSTRGASSSTPFAKNGINSVPSTGRDVLSGKFSGCLMGWPESLRRLTTTCGAPKRKSPPMHSGLFYFARKMLSGSR